MLVFIHQRYFYSKFIVKFLTHEVFQNTLQVLIVKLKMDKDRKKILDRRAAGKRIAEGKAKGKHTEESVAMETS